MLFASQHHVWLIIIMMRYFILALSVLSLLDVTSGQGHLVSPRSRNFEADPNQEGVVACQWHTSGWKLLESCPQHCLNKKEPRHLCGVGNAANHYDDWLHSTGAKTPWDSQAAYYFQPRSSLTSKFPCFANSVGWGYFQLRFKVPDHYTDIVG